MKTKAFTIIELLVIVSIISILSTMWFIAYTNYATDSRDTNRISQVQNIWDWLEFSLAKEESIDLKNPLTITIEWESYSRQWDITDNILKRIKFFWSWEDPSTKEPYILNLSKNNKDYDILSLLEKPSNAPNQINKDAFNLTNNSKLAYIYWKNNIWVFTDSNYVPLNKTNSGTIDIDCSIDQWYKLVFESWVELSPIINQSLNKNWPCYNDVWNYCWPVPNIDNATFTSWVAIEPNQDWIKADNTNSCSYQCDSWYTWLFCENSVASWANQAEYTDIESLLAWVCGIPASEFNTNYNPTSKRYTWNIDCSWAWITDEQLEYFDIFVSIDWDLLLEDNLLTELYALMNLSEVTWKISFKNNSLDDIFTLWDRSSNNFVNIDLSWNNLRDIKWIANLNSIKYLDVSDNNINNISAISSMNNLLSLDLSNNQINRISPIWGRNSLRILDLSNNNISNLSSLFWINNLEYLNISNNLVSSVYPLRDSNNLEYINVSWNNSLSNISYLTSNVKSSGIFIADERNYTWKIHNTANICNNWSIKNINWNDYSTKSNICS